MKAPPAAVALSFFASALAALGAALCWAAAGTPEPFALLHLLALGVFAMVAMGALYQFVPVVGMAPLRSRSLPFVHLALAMSGTVLLVYGFQNGSRSNVYGGRAAYCRRAA